MDELVRRRVRVSGRVQGVWFRASAEREAARLHVGGSARNLPDGDVELFIEGPADAVDALIAWARVGPPRAQVTSVTVEPQTPIGERVFYAR
jgi:acylphosphatase